VDAQTGYGRGVGRNGGAERQFPNYDSIPEDWVTYEGAVVQVPEPGVELLIETSEGEQLQIGTGPMDLSAEGFTLQAGEPLHVTGYWDGDEFKATRLTRLDTGQTLALRDELGRPAWAGSGRNAQSATLPGNGTLGDQSGAGQAQVDGWHEIEGSVVHVEADTLTVLTTDGSEIVLEGRPWRFAQEQGFSAQIGDTLTLIGFYEGDEYEVGLINDATSGQAVTLRNESGRPMWAGRGRGGL
jgi:hypothetical protein